MPKIEYYLDTGNGFLLAYEKSTEFFVRFVPSKNEWETVEISFSQFRHDYEFKALSESEAVKLSKGATADTALEQYRDMIKRNKS